MSGGKVLSLCGSGHTEPRIEYRYGSPGAIEMRHAARLNPNDSTFRLAQYGRAQVQRNTVRFEREGVGYLVFDFQEGTQREAGVEITLPGTTTEKRLSCREPVQAQLERLKGRLACDSDSALQLGRCP